jgi:hypothetical protein
MKWAREHTYRLRHVGEGFSRTDLEKATFQHARSSRCLGAAVLSPLPSFNQPDEPFGHAQSRLSMTAGSGL